jgi:hypothetical protein
MAQIMEAQLQHKYQSYDYQETAENMLKQVRVTIPEELTTVRGILVVSNAAGPRNDSPTPSRYRFKAFSGESTVISW